MKTNDHVVAYSDRNVFILGAGFSVDAGIPVVNNFMNRMRDSASWLSAQSREREARAVANVLKFRLEAAAASYRVNVDVENVEQLFSLASASPGHYGGDVPLAIAATVNFAHQTSSPRRCSIQAPVTLPPSFQLNNAQTYLLKNRSCSRYDLYLALMTGSFYPPSEEKVTTIITFNYDLLVEHSLNRLGLCYSYGLSPTVVDYDESAKATRDNTGFKVLKLHGSVNWASPINHSPKVKIYDDYRNVLDSNRNPLLVPPTWRKHVNELSSIWDEAVRSLQTATRIIIIGYSMPWTDQHFKYLLAAGLQDNISLRTLHFVNPLAESLKDSFYQIFRQQYLEPSVVQFLPYPTARYFLASNCATQIRRTIQPPFSPPGLLDTNDEVV